MSWFVAANVTSASDFWIFSFATLQWRWLDTSTFVIPRLPTYSSGVPMQASDILHPGARAGCTFCPLATFPFGKLDNCLLSGAGGMDDSGLFYLFGGRTNFSDYNSDLWMVNIGDLISSSSPPQWTLLSLGSLQEPPSAVPPVVPPGVLHHSILPLNQNQVLTYACISPPPLYSSYDSLCLWNSGFLDSQTAGTGVPLLPSLNFNVPMPNTT